MLDEAWAFNAELLRLQEALSEFEDATIGVLRVLRVCCVCCACIPRVCAHSACVRAHTPCST